MSEWKSEKWITYLKQSPNYRSIKGYFGEIRTWLGLTILNNKDHKNLQDAALRLNLESAPLDRMVDMMGFDNAMMVNRSVGTYSESCRDLMRQSCRWFEYPDDLVDQHCALITEADSKDEEAPGRKPPENRNPHYAKLRMYAGVVDYKLINEELRSPQEIKLPKDYHPKAKHMIQLFSERDVPMLKHSLVVHRCVVLDQTYLDVLCMLIGWQGPTLTPENFEDYAQHFEGKTFIEDGCLSTATKNHNLFCSRMYKGYEHDVIKFKIFAPKWSRCVYTFCPAEREVLFPPGMRITMLKYLGKERGITMNPANTSQRVNWTYTFCCFMDTTHYKTTVSCALEISTPDIPKDMSDDRKQETLREQFLEIQKLRNENVDMRLAYQRQLRRLEVEFNERSLEHDKIYKDYMALQDRQTKSVPDIHKPIEVDEYSRHIGHYLTLMINKFDESGLQQLLFNKASEIDDVEFQAQINRLRQTQPAIGFMTEEMRDIYNELLRRNESKITFDLLYFVYDSLMLILHAEPDLPEKIYTLMQQTDNEHQTLIIAKELLNYMYLLDGFMKKWSVINEDGKRVPLLNTTPRGHLDCYQALFSPQHTCDLNQCRFSCGFKEIDFDLACKPFEHLNITKRLLPYDRIVREDLLSLQKLVDLTSGVHWWMKIQCHLKQHYE
jgi:hypothetical protein